MGIGSYPIFFVKFFIINMLLSFSSINCVLQLYFSYQKQVFKNHVCPETTGKDSKNIFFKLFWLKSPCLLYGSTSLFRQTRYNAIHRTNRGNYNFLTSFLLVKKIVCFVLYQKTSLKFVSWKVYFLKIVDNWQLKVDNLNWKILTGGWILFIRKLFISED